MIATPWRDRIEDELRQADEEGYDVSALRERMRENTYVGEADFLAVSKEIARCPRRPFRFTEPETWEAIAASMENRPRALPLPADLEDRMLAAWLGRSIGCMMGCPVEGWNAARIRESLAAAGSYPLGGYIPEVIAEKRLHCGKPVREYCREHLDRVLPDDDLAYPILGLLLLEEVGRDFTAGDVGRFWLERLSREFVFTAELVAFENLEKGLKPPETALEGNPYREWIGAQIRADIWGYAAAGDPFLAAELAYRDASVSHVKNGVYGELFFAAAIARAFGTSDPFEAIDAGLRCVPPGSRLAEAVLEVVRWAEEDSAWETTLLRIVARYGRYHWVHVLPNAMVTVMALIHGRGDFLDTVSIAVMAGFDTDCNAATAGSLAGLLYGREAIPDSLSGPIGDRLETFLKGEEEYSITELAGRTADVVQRIKAWPGS